MTKRLAVLAFLGGLLAVLVPSTQAQSDKTELKPLRPAPPQPTRRLYPLQHADPAVLAAVIEKHFADRGVVSATSQGLLVTSASQAEEIGRLIEQLDRPQRQVSVVVTLVEIASKDHLLEMPGTPDQVLTRLVEMAKAGQASLKRVTLTGAEGQPVTTTSGGDRPIVTSRTMGGGGFGGGKAGGAGPQPVTQRSVDYRPLATTVKMTARVRADDAVAVDLSVKDSGVKPAEDDGFSSVEIVDLTTRVTIPPGKAVLVQAVEAKDKASRITVVLVTAKVDGAGK